MDLLSAFFLPRFRRLNGIMHWQFGRISPEKIRRSMCSSTSQMIVRVSLWNAFQIAYYSACVTEQINAQRTIAWIQNVLHLSRIFAFALAFVRFQNHFQENIRFDFLETHFFSLWGYEWTPNILDTFQLNTVSRILTRLKFAIIQFLFLSFFVCLIAFSRMKFVQLEFVDASNGRLCELNYIWTRLKFTFFTKF